MTADNPTIGQMVTITPSLSPGESRDTEPGAQPWQAVCVGYTATKIIVDEGEKYGFRGIDRESVRW
jgi:hypothetical protein